MRRSRPLCPPACRRPAVQASEAEVGIKAAEERMKELEERKHAAFLRLKKVGVHVPAPPPAPMCRRLCVELLGVGGIRLRQRRKHLGTCRGAEPGVGRRCHPSVGARAGRGVLSGFHRSCGLLPPLPPCTHPPFTWLPSAARAGRGAQWFAPLPRPAHNLHTTCTPSLDSARRRRWTRSRLRSSGGSSWRRWRRGRW